MKAIILNSGTGSRMGKLTEKSPKCLVELANGETILSRQLRQLAAADISHIVITTGRDDALIRAYCRNLDLHLSLQFVKNPLYAETNYIYSLNLAKEFLHDDIMLLHGDLVFADDLLERVLNFETNCMTVDSSLPLPLKDFKAVVLGGKIIKVGIEFFEDAVAAQPLYLLSKSTWECWAKEISDFCQKGQTTCYAENALNHIARELDIRPFDVKGGFCAEVDTIEDLECVNLRLSMREP